MESALSTIAVLDDPLEQQRFTRWSTGRDGQRVAESTLRLSGMYCVACAGIGRQQPRLAVDQQRDRAQRVV